MLRDRAKQVTIEGDLKSGIRVSTMNKKITKKSSNKRGRRVPSYQQRKKNQLFIGLGFYVVLTIMALQGSISWGVVAWYVVIGVITYLVYAKDKRAAESGSWRIPETTLHAWSIFGGWVGAMMAQNRLRHKTQKSSFRNMYYLTVIINLAFLLYLVVHADRLAAL